MNMQPPDNDDTRDEQKHYDAHFAADFKYFCECNKITDKDLIDRHYATTFKAAYDMGYLYSLSLRRLRLSK